MLRLAEAERDGPLKEVLLATSAVVFLGCPHRGTEHCSLGDAVRSMAGVTLGPGADPNDAVLQALSGVGSAEMEMGRQAFVRLWNAYGFRVKTFQESVLPSYQWPELRAETVSCQQDKKMGMTLADEDRPFEGSRALLAIRGKRPRRFARCTMG